MPDICLHNAVPVKKWFSKKWICIHCNQVWSIDPTSTHDLLHKVAEFAELMSDQHTELFRAMHGLYVITEEP